ncbi:fasciclin domain-containing protein [Acanthopleuribacter pedis]|uniref:Fasciclin domain-containing protein n=1 Tax=Acanthopleuribacter pedis TaxID=442870 RepID=A0A8J7U966_9BACT|nr:fasciclin domain-containing protein [Acanthopleuribacter pedis]MBO1323346.1 fasciclin domain-containing protein [Acanthopleuribacter pedis]
MRKMFALLTALSFFVSLPATSQDDIVDTAAAAGSFTTLLAAAEAAGLVDTLRSDGPFTVFAPTDDAFAALPEGTVEALLDDPDTLRDILLYHVVSGAVDAATVVGLSNAETVNGSRVLIKADDNGVQINDANVVTADVAAANGIIHVIDAVLLPPVDVVDTAVAAGSFSTLATALTEAGLIETLKGEGPFTVFAPTDDAFAALPEGTLEALLADTDALIDVLTYHVVSGYNFAADVVTLESAVALNGDQLAISVEDGAVRVNDSNVVATDVLASNGVIHVIDAVLIPPADLADIVDTALGVDRFSTLVAAVQAAGLVDALKGDGPFTVFAPNNDAFAALPEGTLDALLADPEALANILTYHVVPGAFSASDVLASSSLTTLQGAEAAISVTDQGAFIDNAQIVATDILTANGIIHEIDAVILPPEPEVLSGTIYEVTITNVTKGQVFSPPVAVVHRADIALFHLGQPASGALRTMAEEGNTQPLADELAPLDQVYDIQTATGPIMPGTSATIRVTGAGNYNLISVAGMLVQTNDTFFAAELRRPVGLDGIFKNGDRESRSTAIAMATAYDAGTEVNDESCGSVPGPPCGAAGAPNTAGAEGYVYIANGIHGIGDLASETYDWRGPVARIVIKRVGDTFKAPSRVVR